jgi:hypothetical protein
MKLLTKPEFAVDVSELSGKPFPGRRKPLDVTISVPKYAGETHKEKVWNKLKSDATDFAIDEEHMILYGGDTDINNSKSEQYTTTI